MSLHDFRKKPDSQWTFYVVDHLPTMDNIYRYDTPQEAIEKYNSLPATQRSALGSSLLDRYELDHIHKIDGQSVLVRDMERVQSPVWRDSEEIVEAVSLMRQRLKVEYELSNLFGSHLGHVAIPICDGKPQNSYFNDKQLDPLVIDRPLSGINEVFVFGRGWVEVLEFLKDMDERKWTRETGYPVPFVNTLNIRYTDSKGHQGQADIAPAFFQTLRDEYERSLTRKPSLDDKIAGAESAGKEHTYAGKDPSRSGLNR